jgi:hypothetical protein
MCQEGRCTSRRGRDRLTEWTTAPRYCRKSCLEAATCSLHWMPFPQAQLPVPGATNGLFLSLKHSISRARAPETGSDSSWRCLKREWTYPCLPNRIDSSPYLCNLLFLTGERPLPSTCSSYLLTPVKQWLLFPRPSHMVKLITRLHPR